MNKTVAYTYSFLSFLAPKLKANTVKNIILFGSTTREELTKESDIDLFIEVYDEEKTKTVKKSIDFALTQFAKSNTHQEWKLRGISNEIKCQTGTLKKQSDLKRSIISNGMTLYSKYTEPIKGKNHTLFSIKPIKEKNKRYRVFRKLFGRKEKRKKTKSLVKELGGKQISTRVFMVPIEQTPTILKILRKEKTDYSMQEISTD